MGVGLSSGGGGWEAWCPHGTISHQPSFEEERQLSHVAEGRRRGATGTTWTTDGLYRAFHAHGAHCAAPTRSTQARPILEKAMAATNAPVGWQLAAVAVGENNAPRHMTWKKLYWPTNGDEGKCLPYYKHVWRTSVRNNSTAIIDVMCDGRSESISDHICLLCNKALN